MSKQKQGITLFTALTTFIATLLIIQLWLVAAALDALLSGHEEVLVPAAVASFCLFAIDVALLLYGLRFDHRLERGDRRE
jgi:hypothetical protein